MAFAVPIELCCLLILWLWLQFYYLPMPCLTKKEADAEAAKEAEAKIGNMIREKCKELGPLAFREAVVLAHFVVLVLLWFFRSPGMI